MSRFAKVSWIDGMFLTPQHFQQLERSLFSSLQLRIGGERPACWGVIHLALNEAAVLQGRLELERCQAILPDGTTIDLPEKDPAPSVRRFELSAGSPGMKVYLSLPSPRARAPLITPETGRADVRLLEVTLEVPDEQVPTQLETLEIAVKNLRLHLEGESMDGFISLPIARVTRTREGMIQLDRDFIPPTVCVAGAPALVRLGQRVLARLISRARGLVETRFKGGVESLDPSGPDAVAFWYFQTLSQHLHPLAHVLEQRDTSPARLYEALLGLFGALSAYAGQIQPEVALGYQHSDPGPGFLALEEHLSELLRRLLPTRYELVPLLRREPYLVGRLHEELLRPGVHLFLSASGDMPPDERISRLPSACKLSDLAGIGRLVRTAVGGLRMRAIARPPSQIPTRADAVYFQLLLEGPEWDAIKSTGGLALYVPSWLPGLTFELMGLKPTEG